MSDEQTELFDRLYRDNQAKVYKLALALAGNAHDAEDITQEAFFRAFRSYDAFRGESSSPGYIGLQLMCRMIT